MKLHLSADDNFTEKAFKDSIKSLANLYEALTGTPEQVLADRIYDLMHDLEDVGFEQMSANEQEFYERQRNAG